MKQIFGFGTKKQSNANIKQTFDDLEVPLASEAILTASQDMVHNTLDQVTTAITMLGLDLSVTFANKSMKTLLQDHLGSFQTLWPGLALGTLESLSLATNHEKAQPLLQALSGSTTLPQILDLSLDGLTLQLALSVYQGGDGQRAGYMIEWRDVTAERAAAEKNFDDNALIQAISDTQAVIQFHPDGTIITANANFCGAMEYALEEIQGQHHRMFVEPAFAQSPEYKEFWKTLASGHMFSNSYRRIKKSGDDIYIRANYTPIRNKNGDVVKVVKFANDITAEVRAQKAKEEISVEIEANFESIEASTALANQNCSEATNVSNQTASVVETVATSAEEFSISSREIAASISTATVGVQSILDQTEVAERNTHELTEVTEAMNSILTLINDIANQINLLALNATIEAARAGESGKGFAVVATEVKSLASDVSKATEQIEKEINSVQTLSTSVAESLQVTKEAVEKVNENVSGIASAADDQTKTAAEVSKDMQTAAGSVAKIAQSLDALSQSTASLQDRTGHGKTLYNSLKDVA